MFAVFAFQEYTPHSLSNRDPIVPHVSCTLPPLSGYSPTKIVSQDPQPIPKE